MPDKNKNSKTVVECYLTGCKYIFTEYEVQNMRVSDCVFDNMVYLPLGGSGGSGGYGICISHKDEEDDYTFSCIDFESGHKKKQCIECIMKDNDGVIPLGDDDIFEIIEVDDDDEFLS